MKPASTAAIALGALAIGMIAATLGGPRYQLAVGGADARVQLLYRMDSQTGETWVTQTSIVEGLRSEVWAPINEPQER